MAAVIEQRTRAVAGRGHRSIDRNRSVADLHSSANERLTHRCQMRTPSTPAAGDGTGPSAESTRSSRLILFGDVLERVVRLAVAVALLPFGELHLRLVCDVLVRDARKQVVNQVEAGAPLVVGV